MAPITFGDLEKMSGGHGKQRNSTQICEQAHDVGRQVVTP
jgi:hypothetical protein